MIETDRLVLRLPTEDDAPFLYHLMNSDGWLQYIGDRNIHDLDRAKEYITSSLLKSYDEHRHTLFLSMLRDGTPIGLCGLLQRPYLDRPDLGFATAPDYERQGYTAEGCRGVMDWARDTLVLDRLYAYTYTANDPSQRLLEHLGFYTTGDHYFDELDATYRLFSYEF